MKKTLAALACLAVLGCSRAPETSAQTGAQKIPTNFYVNQIHNLAVDAGAGAKFWSLGRHLREVDVYRDDLRRYSIRFERYGDFLTVMVDRRGAKTSETLNLGSTRGIRLISGHAPDLGGRLGYVVDETPDDRQTMGFTTRSASRCHQRGRSSRHYSCRRLDMPRARPLNLGAAA